ncbi:MAG: helix-turn-helix domain-containing protein [Prevotella sp.]|nr:helix-turn-helix domain-containing protein [Prevotella sp.]
MGKQLNLEQRQKIAKLLKEGKDFREIAEVLKVDRTTILREVNRNADDSGRYDPQLADFKTKKRKQLKYISSVAVAQLPPNIRAEVDKVWAYETPTVKRQQLIIDKYIKEYGPVIKKKLISPRAVMCALANEFYMSESAIYYMLKREGIYQDADNPVCVHISSENP